VFIDYLAKLVVDRVLLCGVYAPGNVFYSYNKGVIGIL
jgi:hypothetical protein